MRIAVAGATGTVGQYVAAAARARGHDVVGLSRSSGHDVVSGRGLEGALAGCEALVDVTGTATTSAAKSVDFFAAATSNLLAAEQRQGVHHHVALSIVGIDAAPVGYYAGKIEQERLVAGGAVGFSILRTTQFHEFVGQSLRQGAVGPVTLVPTGLLRPVAAAEVAESLVSLAEAGPSGRVRDLRGPRDETLIDMAQRLVAAGGPGVRRSPLLGVSLPGSFWRALRSGVLRGTADSDQTTTTFGEWLVAR